MKRSREPEEAHPGGLAATVLSTNNHGGLSQNPGGDGDTMPPAAKIADLDLSETDGRDIEMRCSLPPHKDAVVFSTYADYEAHYRAQHTNRCVQCRKNFPSAHFLGLHIEETHDSFAQAKRERGERTYSCFVEGCDRKCSTPQKRRMHLVDKHMYPKNYFFAITRDGIDGRRSLLLEGQGRRRRRSAAAASSGPQTCENEGREAMDVEKTTGSAADGPAADSGRKSPVQQPDQEMEDLSSAMSSLQFVPMSVRFGRGKKAGFARR